MEKLKGPKLDIVLSLNEGKDFSFLTSKFLIVASLNNSNITTNAYNGEQVVKFNSDLIWSSDKNNVKKLKNYKVPIRLDFFNVDDANAKNSFGYVILSLKSAQYCDSSEMVSMKEERVKVCGLGKEAKHFSPELTLSLRIQDVFTNDMASAREHGIVTEIIARTSDSSPIIQDNLSQKYVCSKPVDEELSEDVTTLEVCLKYQLDLNFVRINWLHHFKDIHLRVHHSKAEVWWSTHLDIKETIPGTSTSLENMSGRLIFLSPASQILNVISEMPPTITICTNRQGRPHVLAKALISSPSINENWVEFATDFLSLLNGEKCANLVYNAQLFEVGPQKCHQLMIEDNNVLAERMKDELDAWKIKEARKLEEKYEIKLKEEILKMKSLLTEKEDEPEDVAELLCKTLSQQLQKAIADVKQKEKDLDASQQQLEATYRELSEERKCDAENVRKQCVSSMRDKDRTINELQNELESLSRNLQEKEHQSALAADQIQSLLADLGKTKEQLDRMKRTKMFFQEQWGRAVRELHRIKCEGWKDIQVQLKFRKEDLKRLGLDQLINDGDDTYSDFNEN